MLGVCELGRQYARQSLMSTEFLRGFDNKYCLA